MGIKLKRKKDRHFLLSFIYKFQKILPLSKRRKFKLFLDLEWIFDRLAHEASFSFYNEDNHPVRIYSKKFILDHITDTQHILDLGCKYGEITHYLANKAKHVTGIDHDKNAIEIAKSRYQKNNLSFEYGEAFEFLSNETEEYDVLILSHILEHIDEPEEFLKKFKHFFKFIYIEVPDFDRYYLNQYRLDQKNSLIYSDDDHVSEFDRDEIKTILNNCDITILEAEYRFGVQKFWCKVDLTQKLSN